MKASDPRRKLGYCGFPVPRGPWVRVKWLEAVRGSRPMGLETTEVIRLAWVSLLPFPPTLSRAVWTLHSYTSLAWHWAALSCCWPHHWNGISKWPFSHCNPSVTLKNQELSHVNVCPCAGLQDPALSQCSSFPSLPPAHNLVPFLFKSGLPFLDCELVVFRKWVFISWYPAHSLPFAKPWV